jgi:iron-sulfur cluster repair protein YtfE (RIC family)
MPKEAAAMSITAPLQQHHKLCDQLFASAEESCISGDWAQGERAFTRLRVQLEAHFVSEEELLFPAFEEATGMSAGPTEVMRSEHAQMRGLLEQMAAALVVKDDDAFGGAAETLLILMQQHNVKEENILYPMCDNVLGATGLRADLQARLG